MKLGVNTHFIMKFGFEDGLKFCQQLGFLASAHTVSFMINTSPLAARGKSHF